MTRFQTLPGFPRRTVLLVFLPLAVGCASVFHGTRQRVEIFTDPPGATATAGDQKVTTPGALRLLRKEKNIAIRIEKPGFTPKTVALERRTSGLVWLNVVGIASGAIGGAYAGEATSGRSDWGALGNMGTGAVAGAALVPGIGFWTDFQNGAAYRLEPARIVVRLDPAVSSVALESPE
jgi:hypothetical protein